MRWATHPRTGSIDLVWGEAGEGSSGYGLAKIIRKHPEVMDDLQGRLSSSTTILSESPNRIRLTNGRDIFVVRNDFEGVEKKWLLTAYDQTVEGNAQRGIGRRTERAGDLPEGSSPSAPLQGKDSVRASRVQANRQLPQEVEMRAAIAKARQEAPQQKMVDMGDGKGERSLQSILDELDADEEAANIIALCGRKA